MLRFLKLNTIFAGVPQMIIKRITTGKITSINLKIIVEFRAFNHNIYGQYASKRKIRSDLVHRH